jgi:hypothetical protein
LPLSVYLPPTQGTKLPFSLAGEGDAKPEAGRILFIEGESSANTAVMHKSASIRASGTYTGKTVEHTCRTYAN